MNSMNIMLKSRNTAKGQRTKKYKIITQTVSISRVKAGEANGAEFLSLVTPFKPRWWLSGRAFGVNVLYCFNEKSGSKGNR